MDKEARYNQVGRVADKMKQHFSCHFEIQVDYPFDIEIEQGAI